jgi:hypothetical protein
MTFNPFIILPESETRKRLNNFRNLGQIFMEYDLIFVLNGMMFWGARHVDGRGFDTEENRPANLQIPMIKR